MKLVMFSDEAFAANLKLIDVAVKAVGGPAVLDSALVVKALEAHKEMSDADIAKLTPKPAAPKKAPAKKRSRK